MFQKGEVVWAKLNSYPWWPSIVVNADDCGCDPTKNKHWVFWFGDHKISEVDYERIVEFKEFFPKHFLQNSGKYFKVAVQEALNILAQYFEVTVSDPPSLLKWAKSGFKSSLSHANSVKEYEIPTFIEEALQNYKLKNLKRKIIIDDDDSDTDCDSVIADVRKGLKKLEDICIGCCKTGQRVVAYHPLFVGGLCQQCKKCVYKICRKDCGKLRDFCIVCGIGGSLVFCSSNVCLRAYCKVCIEYMASKDAYNKILKNDNWFCYVCETDRSTYCLIRRKKTKCEISIPPPFPKDKHAIRVISQNDIGLKVLKAANIKVAKYSVEPSEEGTSSNAKSCKKYVDFTDVEIKDISADLVIGSYFAPSSMKEDRRKCVTSFFRTFLRFMFRLDSSRRIKPYVRFVFVAEAEIIDEQVLSHVLRYVSVESITVTLGEKKYFIWSNITGVGKMKDHILNQHCKSRDSVEQEVLSMVIKPLKCHFENETDKNI